jgi:regulator of sigma E protease
MISALLFILAFIAILAALIIIHEAGHFFVAKAVGVKILEFGIGFPPRLWGIQRGETLYSINAVPLGGFVRMVGEEDPSEPGSLAEKSVLTRLLVIGAGPFTNAVTALLLFTLLFMVPQDVVVGPVVVTNVEPDSPASLAGVLPGDVVLATNGRTLDNHGDLSYRIGLDLGSEMTWLIRRGVDELQVSLVPRLLPPEGQGATGIGVTTLDYHIEKQWEWPWTALGSGLGRMGDVMVLTKNEVSKWLAGGDAPAVTGPIGMAQAFGEVAQDDGFRAADRVLVTLNLAGVISLSLAIFNVLPIPALDGGRIMFIAIEWARGGKRIAPRKEGLVHLVGFVVLITLALAIGLVDLGRIFRGESLVGG